jgi:hypothetical protein
MKSGSLWRKRNVKHNEQNQPKWFNMTALANNNLSIKSDNLSIKQSKGIEMSIEAMKQALEALQYPLNTSHEGFNVDMAELLAHRAIKALEEALTKQEQGEPVAWMKEGWGPDCGPYIEFYRDDEMGWRDRKKWTPLYTTPQQRTWVGLTDEERESIINLNTTTGLWHMAKDIETKLKEKNT